MNDSSPQCEWTDCRPGEIRALGVRLQAEASRDQLASTFRTAALSGMVVVLAVGASLWLRPEGPLSGITCAQCASHMEAYHAHLTAGAPFDAELAASMRVHLESCPRCRPEFQAMYPGVLSAALRSTGEFIAQRPRAVHFFTIAALR